jgi:predicted transcriptional regulator
MLDAMAKKPPSQQVSVRLDDDVIDRLDVLAASLSRPGLPLTRADAMRIAIATGLESIASESKKKSAKK